MSTTQTIAPPKSRVMKGRHAGPGRKPPKVDLVPDLRDFLENLPAFSYVLLSGDGDCAVGPTLGSAVDLVWCALHDWTYEGPYTASQSKSVSAKAREQLPQIVEDVKTRVRQLRKAGIDFILCWQAFGEKQPHLDWHGDYSAGQLREELIELLRDEIAAI
jgi:hypothetical protein